MSCAFAVTFAALPVLTLAARGLLSKASHLAWPPWLPKPGNPDADPGECWVSWVLNPSTAHHHHPPQAEPAGPLLLDYPSGNLFSPCPLVFLKSVLQTTARVIPGNDLTVLLKILYWLMTKAKVTPPPLGHPLFHLAPHFAPSLHTPASEYLLLCSFFLEHSYFILS